jgi:hypothetical protein
MPSEAGENLMAQSNFKLEKAEKEAGPMDPNDSKIKREDNSGGCTSKKRKQEDDSGGHTSKKRKVSYTLMKTSFTLTC